MSLLHRKTATLSVGRNRLTLTIDDNVKHLMLNATSQSLSQMLTQMDELLLPYQQEFKKRRLYISLDHYFVRYVIMPWQEGITRASDWQAIADNYLRGIYGSSVDTFQIEVATQGFSKPVLVVATDKFIIEQLDSLARQYSWRLERIEPKLTEVIEQFQRQLPANYWLLLAESERLLLVKAEEQVITRFNVAMPPAGNEQQQITSLLKQTEHIDGKQEMPMFFYSESLASPNEIFQQFSLTRLSKLAGGA